MVEIQNRFTDDTASPDCGKWGQPHCVGAPGFEPGTSWSQTRRANQAALRPVPTIVTHLMNASFAYATIRRLAMRTSGGDRGLRMDRRCPRDDVGFDRPVGPASAV